MESNGAVQTPPFPFAGQTITVSRNDDGSIQTDFRGQADPNSMAELKQVLDPDVSLYPDHDVAVGDEWQATPEVIKAQFEITGPKDWRDDDEAALGEGPERSTDGGDLGHDRRDKRHGRRHTQKRGTRHRMIDVQTGHIMKFDLNGTTSIGEPQTARARAAGRWRSAGTARAR